MKLSKQEKAARKAAFHSMSPAKKLEHILTYYKWPILLTLILLLVLGSVLRRELSRKEPLLYLALVNVSVGPDTEDCVTTGKLCDLFMSSYGEGLRWETPAQPSGPHEAGLLKLDNGKLKKTFGWKPVWHMDRTVRAITDWTKAWVQSNETANEELIRQIHEFTLTGSI